MYLHVSYLRITHIRKRQGAECYEVLGHMHVGDKPQSVNTSLMNGRIWRQLAIRRLVRLK